MHGIALKYFLAVTQAGSLSGASKRMHVAVSAISRQIANLEDEIRAPLFNRLPRGMILTEAGELLLAHVRRTVLDSESVLAEIANLHDSRRNEIRVAASEGLAQHFIPMLMADFHKNHTETTFDLSVLSPVDAMRRIIDGQIDVAINFTIEPGHGVAVKHSWPAPVRAVMSTSHPLARKRSVTVEEILAYPLALTDGFSTARSLLERTCALNSIPAKIQIALESNYSQALFKFIGNSEAITLAGYLSVAWRLRQDRLVTRPIKSRDFQSRTLQIQIMEGRVLPALIERFIQSVKSGIDNINHLSD